jgi:hypothetical protein
VTIGSSCEKSLEVVGDLRGRHDLRLVDSGLRVIALDEPEPDRDRARVRIRQVDLPGRQLERPIRSARPPGRPAARPPGRRPSRPRAVARCARTPRSRCCSNWRLPSRTQPSRPWVRATIRSASNSSGTSSPACASGCPTQLLGVGVITAQPLPGLAEELASTRWRAQLLGQLVAARLAVELVLGRVGRLGLGEDHPPDLVELVIDLGLAFPAFRVPSIETTPSRTNPARSQSASTAPNSSANARSCRQTKRAIVA